MCGQKGDKFQLSIYNYQTTIKAKSFLKIEN